MNDIKTKVDNSYYYQQPKDSGPLFAGGHWNDTGNVRGFNPIDFGKLHTVEESLRIRVEQKIGGNR